MQFSRIRLRPLEHEDLLFLRELANDPVVRANVVGWDWPLSLAGQERWFVGGAETATTRRFIVETVDGEKLGLTGLWDVDWRNRTAMTALKIGGPLQARGQGFGSETVNAVMEFAFNDVGLNKLYSTILASNEASLATYVRKCGWTEEGRLREHVWRDGKFVDLVQVGILRDDYERSIRGSINT